MAHLTTSPAGRVLGRSARCCLGPYHAWRYLPGTRPALNTTAAPPVAAPGPTPAAAATTATIPRRGMRAVAAATAPAAAAASVTTAGCKACCGAASAASASAASSSALFGAVSAGAVFGASSALMVPVYALMAFCPRVKLTRALLLNSTALYVSLSLLYAAILAGAWQAGLGSALTAVAASLTSAVTSAVTSAGGGAAAAAAAALAGVDLSPLARMFSAPLVTLLSWIHLLALDALMARDIALDGIRTGTPTAHSVLLCFFFGPTGLLSHAVTRMLLQRGGGTQ